MSRRVDVLVIGGGPAGSTVAVLAARAGAQVVLVERMAFPRDKVCGEFISAEGCRVLERLGLLPDLLAAGGRWMNACRFTDTRGRRLDVELDGAAAGDSAGLGLSRALLDLRLLELSAASGAEVRQLWEAAQPLIEDGRVVGCRLRRIGRGAAEDLHARSVVAADGRRSVLARRVHTRRGDPVRTGPRSWFGLKAHFAADPACLGARVELHLFDGGYAGLATIEDRRINLCLMVRVRALRACGGNPDRLLAERVLRNPAVLGALEQASRCSAWKSVGPLHFGPRCAAAAGALFVGDAAGTLDPYSGEGIAHALGAAELAAPFALAAAERGRLDDASARSYERAWNSRFGRVGRRVRRIGFLLDHPWIGRPAMSLLAGPARRLLPRLTAAVKRTDSFSGE